MQKTFRVVTPSFKERVFKVLIILRARDCARGICQARSGEPLIFPVIEHFIARGSIREQTV